MDTRKPEKRVLEVEGHARDLHMYQHTSLASDSVLKGGRGGSTRSIGCNALPMRFLLPSNFSSVIMIRNRVSNFFILSLFFLYLRRRWFKSQSTGLYFVVFLWLLRRGRELAWWGLPVYVISFFFFRHLK